MTSVVDWITGLLGVRKRFLRNLRASGVRVLAGEEFEAKSKTTALRIPYYWIVSNYNGFEGVNHYVLALDELLIIHIPDVVDMCIEMKNIKVVHFKKSVWGFERSDIFRTDLGDRFFQFGFDPQANARVLEIWHAYQSNQGAK